MFKKIALIFVFIAGGASFQVGAAGSSPFPAPAPAASQLQATQSYKTSMNAVSKCCKNIPTVTPQPSKADIATVLANGGIAGVLAPRITDAVLDKAVSNFGYSLYLQEPNRLINERDIKATDLVGTTLYTTSTAEAARNLIKNIVNPFPVSQEKNYKASIASLPDLNKKHAFAENAANQAILGVALHALDEIYTMRLAGSAFVPAAGTGAQASSSMISMMENEATRRFEKDVFTKFLQASTTTVNDVLREIAAMDAFQQWLDYQRYRQDERIAALIAVGLAKYVNKQTLVSSK